MIAKPRLTPHLAANIFPQMDRADFEALKADIVANGLREKVVICEDQILDGRHRYRACPEAGIEPGFVHWEGDDPVSFVLSMNLHRRHLTPSQRAMIAVALANFKHGGDRSKAQNCALTHAQAAEQLGVSERQVDKGSALLRAEASGRAAPELMEQVRSGKMSLSKAEKLVHLPTEQQREAVSLNESGARIRPETREQRQSKSWARRFEETASRVERMSARMADLMARAETEGEWTAQRKERLASAWRERRAGFLLKPSSLKKIPSPVIQCALSKDEASKRRILAASGYARIKAASRCILLSFDLAELQIAWLCGSGAPHLPVLGAVPHIAWVSRLQSASHAGPSG